ncbi:MAG: flavodoxin domain-containing protein [Planctomycetota bacterium]|nr:flavodoxin domain-containing protein [Planctomycetota bacterium]
MSAVFKAVKVTDNVYWVGAIDWAVRDFHGYSTRRGTTYNAYLILADKVTLVDTVKSPFRDELLARIASVVEPKKIDYIISNHAEMDHSGCLPQVIEAVRPEKVFASAMGVKALADHFGTDGQITSVKDGESLCLGNLNISFVETRMCHWPDSMVSYLHEDELLFSQDAFGMHLASSERFADEIDDAILQFEAARYYANILLPLSPFVAKTLQKAGNLGLPFSIVAPDHGPIWRKGPERIIESYARWAGQERTNKAVVVYDTMWGSTAAMARVIGDGLAAGGAAVKLMPMGSSHRSDVAAEMLDAGALLVGAPTMNNTLFPTLADVLTYLKGLKPKGMVGAAFGSFGWSGEAVKDIVAYLEDMDVEIVGEPMKVKYVPNEAELGRCRQLGLQIAQTLNG